MARKWNGTKWRKKDGYVKISREEVEKATVNFLKSGGEITKIEEEGIGVFKGEGGFVCNNELVTTISVNPNFKLF